MEGGNLWSIEVLTHLKMNFELFFSVQGAISMIYQKFLLCPFNRMYFQNNFVFDGSSMSARFL